MTWSLLATKIRIQGNGTSGKSGPGMMGRSSRVSEANLAGDFNRMNSSKRLYEQREMARDDAGRCRCRCRCRRISGVCPGPGMVANKEQ